MPKGKYVRTAESKKKMSLSRIGMHLSDKTIKKMQQAKKNMSEETKNKIRLANIGRNNPNWGKHHTEETKNKIILNSQINPNYGMKGKHHTEKTKKKLSESHRGEKCYLWKGGISYEPYSIDWTNTLRKAIRERDHYTCQLCGEKQGDITHSVHHIDYNKKNCNSENLITLCHKCHIKTNNDRNKWIELFKDFLKGGVI